MPLKASLGMDTNPVFQHFRVVKNITSSMPDDLARRVRILAAEADTSMSQFLCRLAAEKVAADESYETAMKRYLSRNRSGLRLAGQNLPAREEIHDRDALR